MHLLLVLNLVIIALANVHYINIDGPNSDVSVLYGSNVILPCRVKLTGLNSSQRLHQEKFFSQIYLQWMKDSFGFDNQSITDFFGGRFEIEGNLSNGEFNLKIHNVTMSDSGDYACQTNVPKEWLATTNIQTLPLDSRVPFKTSIGLVKSSVCTLKVIKNTKETLISTEKCDSVRCTNVIIGLHEITTFTCTADDSWPLTKLGWFIDDQVLLLENDEMVISSSKAILQNTFISGEVLSNHKEIYNSTSDITLYQSESKLIFLLKSFERKRLRISCGALNRQDFIVNHNDSLNIAGLESTPINIIIHGLGDVKITVKSNRANAISQQYLLNNKSSELVVVEDKEVELFCSSEVMTPESATISYRWELVQSLKNGYNKTIYLTGNSSSLIFLPKIKFKNDMVKCHISSEILGSRRLIQRSASHRLNILVGPHVKDPNDIFIVLQSTDVVSSRIYKASSSLKHKTITQEQGYNEDIELFCDIESNPKPSYSWFLIEDGETRSLSTFSQSIKIPRITNREFVNPDVLLASLGEGDQDEGEIIPRLLNSLFVQILCSGSLENFETAYRRFYLSQPIPTFIIGSNENAIVQNKNHTLVFHLIMFPVKPSFKITILNINKTKEIVSCQIYKASNGQMKMHSQNIDFGRETNMEIESIILGYRIYLHFVPIMNKHVGQYEIFINNEESFRFVLYFQDNLWINSIITLTILLCLVLISLKLVLLFKCQHLSLTCKGSNGKSHADQSEEQIYQVKNLPHLYIGTIYLNESNTMPSNTAVLSLPRDKTNDLSQVEGQPKKILFYKDDVANVDPQTLDRENIIFVKKTMNKLDAKAEDFNSFSSSEEIQFV